LRDGRIASGSFFYRYFIKGKEFEKMIEILKAILFGIVEGITEWLPISSTGHLILLNEFITFNVSPGFWDMFEVVIQLGAIMAVVVLYFKELWPFARGEKYFIKQDTFMMWLKIVVACIPAAVVKVLWGDFIKAHFYNCWVIAGALIVFGIAFIIIENRNKKLNARMNSIQDITFKAAFIIGMFQVIAAVFPGTSRSGATILGGILIGVSRGIAAEFTFFLAIPVMFGASLMEMLDFGFHYTGMETAILLVGTIVAFAVSVLVIKFLMSYIKKHDFKVFGWYRILLGIVVFLYFLLRIKSV
jgi:undecaprenyl-diphosphatase